MHIPRAWARATAEASHDGRAFRVAVWGWGDDASSAQQGARERLQRVLERVRRGEPLPSRYGYGNRPLREEILRSFEEAAIVTRNSYGAQVLNAARLLFLDVDLEPPGFLERLKRLFGAPAADAAALARLRAALQQYGKATFRLYRTASGFRALAIDREFDPAGREAQDLMQATGTDRAFAQLCVAQKSFRARLTPKPWRCGSPLPPGSFPREESDVRARFAAWLAGYEKAALRYASCRYLETVGSGSPRGAAGRLIELHDRETRAGEALPLA